MKLDYAHSRVVAAASPRPHLMSAAHGGRAFDASDRRTGSDWAYVSEGTFVGHEHAVDDVAVGVGRIGQSDAVVPGRNISADARTVSAVRTRRAGFLLAGALHTRIAGFTSAAVARGGRLGDSGAVVAPVPEGTARSTAAHPRTIHVVVAALAWPRPRRRRGLGDAAASPRPASNHTRPDAGPDPAEQFPSITSLP